MHGKLPSPAEPPDERMRLLKPQTLTPVSPIDLFESDEHALYELGSPLYRTARYRSGLGYIETQAELARFQGLMLHSLFSGKFPTARDPLSLLAVLLCAVLMAVIPLILIAAAIWLGELKGAILVLLVTIPDFLFGVAMLGTFLASVGALLGAWE